MQEILQTRVFARFAPLGFLAGDWSVARTVDQPAMTFAGRATFADGSQAPGGLVWREVGALTVGGRTTTARRTLLLLAEDEAPAVLQVRFEDGRPFHRLAFDAGGRAVAEHPCAADHYAGVYAVQDDDRFTVTWRVTGPAKDAMIVSRYARAA